MAARGSAVRRRERRMRAWWRHEQASVRMAMIIAGHHSYRKAAGIEIGVQAGIPLAPVTEYVAPAPAVDWDVPATVIEYMPSAPVFGYLAPAPAVSLSDPSQQLPSVYTTTTVTDLEEFIEPVYDHPLLLRRVTPLRFFAQGARGRAADLPVSHTTLCGRSVSGSTAISAVPDTCSLCRYGPVRAPRDQRTHAHPLKKKKRRVFST